MVLTDPELLELRGSIDRQVAVIVSALSDLAVSPPEGDPATHLAEHRELVRQLGVLRDRVSRAQSELNDLRTLRAELATLEFFARTLRTDVENLRASAHEAREEAARQERAALLELERSAAQREEALRRRDALQAEIVQLAEALARGDRRQCRRTVPVLALDEGVTVCSVGVATPKRPFRPRRFWLVTLTGRCDQVLARRI
jgi:hypothetical protein